jgi:RNA polymerase sigma-B factor
MVRPSRRVQDLYLRVCEEQRGLVLELGRDPTPAEIGERVGARPDDVVEALQAGRLRHSASLDSSPSGDDGPRLAERLASKDRGVEVVDDHLVLNQLLDRLPQREQCIIRLRFLGNLTQGEIAEEMGLSQAHVQRLLVRTLNQLRLLADAS